MTPHSLTLKRIPVYLPPDPLRETGAIWAGKGRAIKELLGFPAAVVLNIIFLSFSGGSVLEGFTKLYYYRRGLANG